MERYVFQDEEELIPLAKLGQLPEVASILGGKVGRNGMWRYHRIGVDGVKLPTMRTPRGACSSLKAVRWFVRQMNQEKVITGPAIEQHEQADKALAAAGI